MVTCGESRFVNPESSWEVNETMVMESVGDATKKNIYKSAPHSPNSISTWNRRLTKPYRPDISNSGANMSDKMRVKELPEELGRLKVKENFRYNEVKNSTTSPCDAHSTRVIETREIKKLTVLEHNKLRITPTTQSLLRQATACVVSNNYIPSDHSRLGDTPQFLPRQVQECEGPAEEPLSPPIPCTDPGGS